MTESEKRLLLLIHAETVRVATLSGSRDGSDNDEWARRRIARDDLPRIGVRVSGNWLGTFPTDRKARSRGLARLERLGLVTTAAANGVVTTHVKLTPSGVERARALAGLPSDRPEVSPLAPSPVVPPAELSQIANDPRWDI